MQWGPYHPSHPIDDYFLGIPLSRLPPMLHIMQHNDAFELMYGIDY
jgi:hypothetical protein